SGAVVKGRAPGLFTSRASLWCGSRFFTQSGAVDLARCRHGSEREGEPRYWSRSKRSRHLRLHPEPSSTRSTKTVLYWEPLRLGHAAASIRVARKSVSLIHIRCRI